MTRILIIDDSLEFRMMVEKMLVYAGYETIFAVDGEDGLRQAIVEQPDMILLDYMMPGMNGAEVFRELRENSNTAPIPVIMITAFTTQFETETLTEMRLMLDDFLTKPIMSKELVSRIQKVFATRRIAGMQ